MEEGLMGNFVSFRDKPPLFLTKSERHRFAQLDRQSIRLNSFVQLSYYSILSTILPFYHAFKRKNKIRMMSLTYRIGNSKLHEIAFNRYLHGLKGAVCRLLYDYDLFICFNKPDWPFEPPMLHIYNIYAYGSHSKRYSNPFIKECRRLRKIKI